MNKKLRFKKILKNKNKCISRNQSKAKQKIINIKMFQNFKLKIQRLYKEIINKKISKKKI